MSCGNYKNLRKGDCVRVIQGFHDGLVGEVHWMGTVRGLRGYSIQVNYVNLHVSDVVKIGHWECDY